MGQMNWQTDSVDASKIRVARKKTKKKKNDGNTVILIWPN